jgi:S-DNA-T family DNA segregation ATPase FtsK/SpoIIIE
MQGLLKKFKQDIFGIFWLAIGLFVGVSLWSHFPGDPSLNSLHLSASVKNYCGYAGSFLSDLLFQSLGLAAWIFVLIPLRVSYFYLREGDFHWEKGRVLLTAVFLFTVTSLLSLYFPTSEVVAGKTGMGGVIGSVMSSGLVSVFNEIGVSIILWSLVLIFFIFYSEKSLVDTGKVVVQAGGSVPEKIAPVYLKVMNKVKSLSTFFKKNPRVRKEISLRPRESSLEAPPNLQTDYFKVSTELPGSKTTDLEADLLEADSEDEVGHEGEDSTQGLINRLEQKRKSAPKRKTRVENWILPKTGILGGAPATRVKIDDKTINKNIRLLEDKLHQFSVKGSVVTVKPGPAVTMFEYKPNADVKISKITELADDLSLAMSAESVRIIAPLPGRDVVGIETSNPQRDTVYLREIVDDESFWDEDKALPLALGKQADGEPKVVDLRKMPHLLVAGTTGSGKSVFVVSALTGLLFKHSPKTMKLILIDPKQVDLAVFHEVPHLLMPPIKEPKKAVHALKWAIREMDKRYRSMSHFGARNMEGFNETVRALSSEKLEGYAKLNEEMEMEGKIHESFYFNEIPLIVIVVEEFGDLMAVDKANVEQSVVRLAQMARACGIHLILAMQSPRKDVVTGLIKTNIPGRISFKVASKMDSRIILDESGADRLLARGDMLFLAPGVSKPGRHHAPWAPENEIQAVTKFWSNQAGPEYDPVAMKMLDGSGGGFDLSGEGEIGDEEMDDRYNEILNWVTTQKEVSASLLQRKFRLGYPRAARMIEIFEQESIVGPAQGSKPRQVLLNR